MGFANVLRRAGLSSYTDKMYDLLITKKKSMKEVEKVFIFFCAVPVPVKRTLRRMGGPVVSLTMTERRWICKTTLTVHLLL